MSIEENSIEQEYLAYRKTLQKKPCPFILLNTLAQNCLVEPEGVEPSSSKSFKELSTCLVTDWIVGKMMGSVADPYKFRIFRSFDD